MPLNYYHLIQLALFAFQIVLWFLSVSLKTVLSREKVKKIGYLSQGKVRLEYRLAKHLSTVGFFLFVCYYCFGVLLLFLFWL